MKTSSKTVDEILEFVKKKVEAAEEAGVWSHVNAFKVIEKYIEDKSPALTAEEKEQMKPKVNHVPVRRGEVDEDEVNKK